MIYPGSHVKPITNAEMIKALQQSKPVPSKENKRLSIGDEIELANEKVTIIDIVPHPEVKGSVYYKFSNGKECRDIRLH